MPGLTGQVPDLRPGLLPGQLPDKLPDQTPDKLPDLLPGQVLRLTRIAKCFGSRAVLKNLSLEVLSGTISLLVGPNGAGKTTLLKIMAGLTRPDTGRVDRACADGELGYLGHATFIYPGLSAFENLAFWYQAHRCTEPEHTHGQPTLRPRERILAVLERVELTRFAEERAGTFSRGMAQRLNLARILLQQPRLLLLDEPGTGLDVRSLSLLHREIALARENGVAVVWITHDATSDAARADRILALADRTLVYDGPVSGYPSAQPEPATLALEHTC